MDKTRTKKNVGFILIILILCIVVFFGYFFVKGGSNPITDFIDKVSEKEKFLENYNGIYTYYDDLNGSKFIFSGCSVSKIANHILIINDDYYTYRSSCMGTYPKESGNISDLNIRLASDKKSYEVEYNNQIYAKDTVTMGIVPNNDIAKKMKTIELGTYDIFMKETEFEGNYYNIEKANISGVSSGLKMSIIRDVYDNSFNLFIIESSSKDKRTIYTYNINDFNYLPSMYAYGKSIAIIEKGLNKNNPNRLGYSFKVVSPDGIVYKLEDMFPITINDVVLNSNNSIYITFDQSKRVFRMLVGFDEKMCSTTYDDSDKNNVSYYEFTIEYNYSISGFDKPKFVKIGYKSEGCKYVNSIMGG